MKSTIVPAQVTTTEDKIVGSISVTQLILLVIPVFVGGMSYAIMPPSLKFSLYKVFLVLILFIVFGIMAIRIKGRLVMDWILILHNYNRRPRYYVFDKNSVAQRNITKEPTLAKNNSRKNTITIESVLPHPSLLLAEELVNHPGSRVSLKLSRKGGFHVLVSKGE